MLLVIFGAGASYDSADMNRLVELGRHHNAVRLPLAKDLVTPNFDDVAASIPASRPIIDLLRRRMDPDGATSLETALAAIAEASGGSAERRQQLMAFRFYLHRVINDTANRWLGTTTRGFTHYLTLMNEIYEWHLRTGLRVSLATFNYDILLDLAAEDVVTGWDFSRQLPRYVERDDFRLFKLHGSTDWARLVETEVPFGTQSLRAAMTLAAEDRIPAGVIEAHFPSDQIDQQHRLFLPALAVPMAGKTAFECPPEHVAILRSVMSQVTHVLIVGWRAAERHAVELLEGADPQNGLMPGYALGLVTGSQQDADEVEHNLGSVWDRARVRFVAANGFSSFIENLTMHMTDLLN